MTPPLHERTLRRYCGILGAVVVATTGGGCPECGPRMHHMPLADQSECSAYVRCDAHHGHPCDGRVGHTGPHTAARCAP